MARSAKGDRLIVTLRDGLLLSRSSVIADFPSIQELLEQEPTLSENRLEALPPDDARFFRDVYPTARDAARDEWTRQNCLKAWLDLGPDPEKRSKCDLCHTPIRYVFYIENPSTGQELQVGKECIEDFPLIRIKTIEECKRDAQRIRRLDALDAEIPNVKGIIDHWANELDQFSIVIPKSLQSPYMEARINAVRLLEECLSGETPDPNTIDALRTLIAKQPGLLAGIKDYVGVNEGHRFVANKTIENWCESQRTASATAALKSIRDTGRISEQVLWRITEHGLLRELQSDFALVLAPIDVIMDSVDTSRDGYILHHQSHPTIRLLCPHQKLAFSYGSLLFGKEPATPLELRAIVDMSRLSDAVSENAVLRLITAPLAAAGFRFEDVEEFPDELVLRDTRADCFMIVDRSKFLENAKAAVYISDVDAAKLVSGCVKSMAPERLSRVEFNERREIRRGFGR